jgi:hypothetical protein
MHRQTLTFVTLLAISSGVLADDLPDIDWIAEAEASGVWNDNRTAAAISIPSENRTNIYVLLVHPDDQHVAIDISRIEDGLFAKLGTADRTEYEKYESTPIEWEALENGKLLLTVRLRVWRDGQRYTVSGPVIIRPDGSVLWQ